MNLQKDAIVKSGFFSTLQLITAGVSYVCIYILVISKLGREQLGGWSMITALPALLALLWTGVSGSMVKYIPTYQAKKQFDQVNKLVVNGFLLNLLIGFLIITLAFLFTAPILYFMLAVDDVPIEYHYFFYYASITFYINFLSAVLLSALEGLQKIPLKNKILINATILFCFVALLLTPKFGHKGLFYAQLFQALTVMISAFFAMNVFRFNYKLAIAIVSLYIILSFKSTFVKPLLYLKKIDAPIYLVSIFFPSICAVFALANTNLNLLLGLAILHCLSLIVLIYKNEFLMDVVHTLVKKKKLQYGSY